MKDSEGHGPASRLDDLPPRVMLHVEFARERFLTRAETKMQIICAIREEDFIPRLAFVYALGQPADGVRKAVNRLLLEGPFRQAALFSEAYVKDMPAGTMEAGIAAFSELHATHGKSMKNWPTDLRRECVLIVVAEPLRCWQIALPFTRSAAGVTLHEEAATVLDSDKEGVEVGGAILKEIRRLVRLKPEQAN